MNIEEIFRDISAHMIKGMMVHDKLADYYDFLSLRGYKRCHEYHFRHEMECYRKLHRYYINHHHKLIEETAVSEPDIIPASWYRYTRQDVDPSTKRTAVKSGIEKWIAWESDTLSVFKKAYTDLCDIGENTAAIFIMDYIKEVEHELKHAGRYALDLAAVEYDMGYILSEQTRIHDKYKRM